LENNRGMVYYRLLMTDKDGSSSVSKVVSLKLAGMITGN
jgi:hypothetical protein